MENRRSKSPRYKKLSEDEQILIKDAYISGLSYREIKEKHGYGYGTLSMYLTRLLSKEVLSERQRKRGQFLTEGGREKLRENGRNRIKHSSKILTNPERVLIEILRDEGVGILFPSYIEEMFSVQSDKDGELYSQYPIQRYVCDFVSLSKKTVIRVNGDFWHGNPLLYEGANLSKIQKFNIGRDILCKNYLESEGWIVCDLWETDILWNKERVKNTLRSFNILSSVSQAETPVPDWSETLKSRWFKTSKPVKEKQIAVCPICGVEFCKKQENSKYCSAPCAQKVPPKVEAPPKEILETEVATMTCVSLGKKYGVSDNTIRNWANRYGITQFKQKKR